MLRPIDSEPVPQSEPEPTHREILEKAFQDLSEAFRSGNAEEYRRIESAFIRELSGYWRDRLILYMEALQATDNSALDGRRQVVNGETLMITKQEPFRSSQRYINLIITRVSAENESDSLEMHFDPLTLLPFSTNPYRSEAEVKLRSTAVRHMYPDASEYVLRVFNGQIASFKRVAQIGKPLTAGHLTRTEAVGYNSQL